MLIKNVHRSRHEHLKENISRDQRMLRVEVVSWTHNRKLKVTIISKTPNTQTEKKMQHNGKTRQAHTEMVQQKTYNNSLF